MPYSFESFKELTHAWGLAGDGGFVIDRDRSNTIDSDVNRFEGMPSEQGYVSIEQSFAFYVLLEGIVFKNTPHAFYVSSDITSSNIQRMLDEIDKGIHVNMTTRFLNEHGPGGHTYNISFKKDCSLQKYHVILTDRSKVFGQAHTVSHYEFKVDYPMTDEDIKVLIKSIIMASIQDRQSCMESQLASMNAYLNDPSSQWLFMQFQKMGNCAYANTKAMVRNQILFSELDSLYRKTGAAPQTVDVMHTVRKQYKKWSAWDRKLRLKHFLASGKSFFEPESYEKIMRELLPKVVALYGLDTSLELLEGHTEVDRLKNIEHHPDILYAAMRHAITSQSIEHFSQLLDKDHDVLDEYQQTALFRQITLLNAYEMLPILLDKAKKINASEKRLFLMTCSDSAIILSLVKHYSTRDLVDYIKHRLHRESSVSIVKTLLLSRDIHWSLEDMMEIKHCTKDFPALDDCIMDHLKRAAVTEARRLFDLYQRPSMTQRLFCTSHQTSSISELLSLCLRVDVGMDVVQVLMERNASKNDQALPTLFWAELMKKRPIDCRILLEDPVIKCQLLTDIDCLNYACDGSPLIARVILKEYRMELEATHNPGLIERIEYFSHEDQSSECWLR